eukprot:6204088-Pleurochrysis_carterae.AAC.1
MALSAVHQCSIVVMLVAASEVRVLCHTDDDVADVVALVIMRVGIQAVIPKRYCFAITTVLRFGRRTTESDGELGWLRLRAAILVVTRVAD